MYQIQWREDFVSGEIGFIAIVAITTALLLAPGLVIVSYALHGLKPRLESLSRWLVLGALLSVAWTALIYSLAYGQSVGGVSAQSVQVSEEELSELSSMAEVEDAKVDQRHRLARGGFIGGLEYFALAQLSPNPGDRGPSRRPPP